PRHACDLPSGGLHGGKGSHYTRHRSIGMARYLRILGESGPTSIDVACIAGPSLWPFSMPCGPKPAICTTRRWKSHERYTSADAPGATIPGPHTGLPALFSCSASVSCGRSAPLPWQRAPQIPAPLHIHTGLSIHGMDAPDRLGHAPKVNQVDP